MKRESNPPDLSGAFPEMPQDCKTALLTAARSVKEEQPMKRASVRTFVIVIAILIAATAIALAAGSLAGWNDFFSGYNGIRVPAQGQAILDATQPKTYAVGPMTFTVKQLLADGHIAMSATDIKTTDGSEALYSNGAYECIGAGTKVISDKYSLPGDTTWLDAAKALKLPLYDVRAILEIDMQYSSGEAMEDPMWNQDGTATYFSMPFTDASRVPSVLPATLFLRVAQYDPNTGEEINKWTSREAIEIPVAGKLESKVYLPVDAQQTNGVKLVSVRADRYATGAYVYAAFSLPADMTEDMMHTLYDMVSFCDESGAELPHGISLSSAIHAEGFPAVLLETMLSLDALPAQMQVNIGDSSVLVK